MTQWEIIKGTEADFEGAPEWARFKDTVAWNNDLFWWSEGYQVGDKFCRVDCLSNYPSIYNGSEDKSIIVAERIPVEVKSKKKKRKKSVKKSQRKVTKVLVLYGDETEYTIKNPVRITVEEEYTTIVTAEEVDGDFEDVVKTTSIKIRNSSLDKIVITTPRFASMVCYNRENYEHGSTVVIENGSMKFVNHVEYYNLTLEE